MSMAPKTFFMSSKARRLESDELGQQANESSLHNGRGQLKARGAAIQRLVIWRVASLVLAPEPMCSRH